MHKMMVPFLLVSFLSFGCAAEANPPTSPRQKATAAKSVPVTDADFGVPKLNPGEEVAVFAGGCFWCMESAFQGLKGVRAVISGFDGGKEKRPTYHQVSSGRTGHAEAIFVVFDPKVMSYEGLLRLYWHNVDPTDKGGQFCDRGTQYRPEIFYRNESQKKAAEQSRKAIRKELKAPVVVEITPTTAFTAAEEYHQDFFLKNPSHYHSYRTGCGRDRRLQKLWGKSAGH